MEDSHDFHTIVRAPLDHDVRVDDGESDSVAKAWSRRPGIGESSDSIERCTESLEIGDSHRPASLFDES